MPVFIFSALLSKICAVLTGEASIDEASLIGGASSSIVILSVSPVRNLQHAIMMKLKFTLYRIGVPLQFDTDIP